MAYDIVIRVIGQDEASAPLGHVNGALGNIAQFAAGGLLVSGMQAIGGAILGAGRDAIDSVANYERLGMTLESLVARELKNASGVEKTIAVGKERIQLTQAEIAQLDSLKQKLTEEGLARETLGARINEQKERIRQLTAQYGENGLVVIKEKARLAEMENAYTKSGTAMQKYGSQIDALESKNGKLVDVTKKVVEGQLSMNDALRQAGPIAAELIQWTEKLAILSPFKSEDIAASLQTAMNFKFSSEQAKRLTKDLVDMASATGKTGASMGLISYALGQINGSDKLLMQDLRQLINAGVDVQGVLAGMGLKLSDVGEKAIDSKQFIEALLTTWETDFSGAAERNAGTLGGLLSSLDEIKDLALRDIFTGAFTEAKPLIAGVVDMMTSPAFRAGLQNFGAGLGRGVSSFVGSVKTAILFVTQLFALFQAGRDLGLTPLQAIQNILQTFVPPELMPALNFLFSTLDAGIAGVERFVGLFQAGMALGLPPILALQNALRQVLPPEVFSLVMQFGAGLNQIFMWGQQLAAIALPLLGQAFALAGQNMGTVAPILGAIALVLGLISAPIIAIPAALVLLGTAWANNWGGIQEKTSAVWGVIQPVLSGIIGFLVLLVTKGLEFATILQVGIPAAILVFQTALGMLQPVFVLLGRAFGAVISMLTTLGTAWNHLNGFVVALQNYLGGVIAKLLGIHQGFADTQNKAVSFGDLLQTVGKVIMDFYETQLHWLIVGFELVVGLLESLAHWLGIVGDALGSLQIPEAFQRHSPSPFEQMLMNSNAHLREMRGLLPGSLGALDGFRGPQLAFASAAPRSYGFAGGPAQPQSKSVHFHGPVTIRPHDYNEFKRQLYEDVTVEERFG